MNKSRYKESCVNLVLAAGIVMAYVLLIYFWFGIVYEVYDDRVIKAILSGQMTGTPDAHTVYLGYIFSNILAFAYKMFENIPWYGIAVFTCLCTSLIVILFSLLAKTKKWYSKIVVIALFALLILLPNIYTIANPTYTSVAVYLAVAGYVVINALEDNKRAIYIFVILEALAFAFRKDSMLMVLPFGMFFILYNFYINGTIKSSLKKGIKYIVALVSVILLGTIAYNVGYSSQEWKDYLAYNDDRTYMFDYVGAPSYEEVSDILDKYKINETEYLAFTKYVNTGSSIDKDCIHEIKEYAASKAESRSLILEIKNKYLDSIQGKGFINYFVIIMIWAIAILISILKKEKKLAARMGGLIFVHCIVWGYLEIRGRLPLRVVMPLNACETIFAVGILNQYFCRECKSLNDIILKLAKLKELKISKIITSTIIFIICLTAILFSVKINYKNGKNQALYIKNSNYAVKLIADGLKDIQSYCNKNQDNRYIVDINVEMYARGDIFNTDTDGKINYIVSGGWQAYSPLFNKRFETYIGEWNNELYLIKSFDKGDEAYSYYVYQTNVEPEEIEQITLATGGIVIVYKFSSDVK